MAKIRINKMDAARRQINAAIRMTFDEEDPIAIHSVVAAGHRIIRDICEQRGDIESYLQFTDWIAPGHEADFWRAVNSSANFIKHAVEDAHAIHELDDEAADYMIVFASRWYGDLGNVRSTEMNVFAYWWSLLHPEVWKPNVLESIRRAGYDSQHSTLQKSMLGLNRGDRLKTGRLLFLNQRAASK
jgi:hypothetical protein